MSRDRVVGWVVTGVVGTVLVITVAIGLATQPPDGMGEGDAVYLFGSVASRLP